MDGEIKALEKQIKLEKLKLIQKELEKLKRKNQEFEVSKSRSANKNEVIEQTPKKKKRAVKKKAKANKPKTPEGPVQNLYLESFEGDPEYASGSIIIEESSRDQPAERTTRHTTILPGRPKLEKRVRRTENSSKSTSKSRDCLSYN